MLIDMTRNWTRTTLFEAIGLQRGFDLPAADRRPGAIPVVASTSVVGWHNEARVRGPGVVIGRSGSIGGAQWIEGDYWPLNTTLWLKELRGNDPRFAYYLLKSIDFSRFNVGSGVPTLNRNHLSAVNVDIPPLEEQRRIAGVLGALDDLIDTNEQLAARCASLRLALTEKALEGASDSKPLSSLATFVNGKNFTKGAVGTGRPVIRTPEVRVGPSASTVRSDIEADDDFVASRGDILFVWSGSLLLGRWLFETGLINQHIFKVKPNPGVPDWLVYGLIEHQMPWFLGLAADKATTMGHIQRRHLDEPVPVPDPKTVDELDSLIQPLWEAEIELAAESQQLRRTRDELLPLLMSGKVRVHPDESDQEDAQAGAA